MLHAMILAGGGGTRFWPRSRKRRPKQFLTLAGERSLLQLALDRLEAMVPPERMWVITGAAYVEETRTQLPSLPVERVVGEPVGRDTAAAILDLLRQHEPDLHAALVQIANAWETPARNATLQSTYPTLKRISIDKAVMEKAREVLVVRAPYQWDDVGSWLALERMNPQDADRNTIQALHAGLKTSGCVIVGDAGRLIATAGVKDLLIVQDGDATLVADRHDENAVKQPV